MAEHDLTRLVFRSGISTSPVVTDVSGRGLGLAIVQEKVEGLGGSIDVASRPGAGTSFRLLLPVTLASLRGVVVSTAGQSFVIPTAGIERVERVGRDAIRSVENRDTVHLNGHTLSVVRLADLLELERPAATAEASVPLLVLAAGGERIAVAVDRIELEQEVLLKDLGGRIVRARNVSGVTMLSSGQLAPVLNVSDLIQSSRGVSLQGTAARAEPQPAAATSVLVVEDSITARSLLKNILEASGYQVRTAVDGIDALTTLRVEPVDIVVSDVEMPRMNGFDLTARIRADRALAGIPVILVTALDSREHRERGIEVGASAYIVKSKFDQAGLLQAIRRLAG
jgi:two-component system chemotaxis sensor kinase CheA